VLPKGYYYLQVTVYFAYSDFTCNIKHTVYYTVTTIRLTTVSTMAIL